VVHAARVWNGQLWGSGGQRSSHEGRLGRRKIWTPGRSTILDHLDQVAFAFVVFNKNLAIANRSRVSCSHNTLRASTVWVKNFYRPPLRFSEIFSQKLIIFSKTFTRLLRVHTYVKLQNVIQLSQTMTKLCRIKRDHPVNFYISPEF